MADGIRETVSSLKELLSLLEKVKAQAGGESLVQDFLSMGTGDKDIASGLQQHYKNLEDAAGSDLYTETLKQANDELRNHVELLKIAEGLRESVASVPTPVATSAPVVRSATVVRAESARPAPTTLKTASSETDITLGLNEEGQLSKRTAIGNRQTDFKARQIISYLTSKRGRTRLDVNPEEFDPSTLEIIRSLQQELENEKKTTGVANTKSKERIVTLFNKLFPKSTKEKDEQKNELAAILTPILQQLGGEASRRVATLRSGSNEDAFRLLESILDRVVVKYYETDSSYQTVKIDSGMLRQSFSQVAKKIQFLLQSGARHIIPKSEISYADTSDMSIDQTIASLFADAGLDDSMTGPSVLDLSGTNIENIPGSPSGLHSRNAKAIYKSKDAINTRRGQSALRQALRGKKSDYRQQIQGEDYGRGTEVAGYSPSQLFGGGPDTYIEQQVKSQREQINEEITKNDLVDVQIGTRTIQLPRTLANSRVAIQRAVAAMSQDTTLVGRRGSEEGPIGVYGSGSLGDSVLDLHKADMLQQFLENPGAMIPQTSDNSFLERVVYQQEAAPTQNSARLYATRMMEQFKYQEQQAYMRQITGSTQSTRNDAAAERETAVKNQRFLQEILSETTNPQRRGELLGVPFRDASGRLDASRPGELSADEALQLMFGAHLTGIAPFSDASIGIIQTAQTIGQGLAAQGLPQPVQSYTTPTILQRILKASSGYALEQAVSQGAKQQSYAQQVAEIGTPHTRTFMGREVEMGNTVGMVEKEIMDVMGTFFGLTGRKDSSVFSALHHAGRITDESGAIKPIDEITSQFGKNQVAPLNAIFSGAEQLKEFSLQGLPILDYAKLRQVDQMGGTLTADERAQLDATHAHMPMLENLTENQVNRLAGIDVNKNTPKEIIAQVIGVVGKSIRAEIEKILAMRAREAGKSAQDVAVMLDHFDTTGQVREEDRGFEGFLRARSFFDESRLRDNPDMSRAFALLQQLGTAQDQGQTQAQFLAQSLGARLPADIPITEVNPTDRYNVLAAARAITEAETGSTTAITDANFPFKNAGADRTTLDRYFAGLRAQVDLGQTEEERARARRIMAMHQEAAKILGNSVQGYEGGYIEPSHGFGGMSQEERLTKFLNYHSLSQIAPDRLNAQEQDELMRLETERTQTMADFGGEDRPELVYTPVIPNFMNRISSSDAEMYARTPFQGLIKESNTSDSFDSSLYESPIALSDFASRLSNTNPRILAMMRTNPALVVEQFSNNINQYRTKLSDFNSTRAELEKLQKRKAVLSRYIRIKQSSANRSGSNTFQLPKGIGIELKQLNTQIDKLQTQLVQQQELASGLNPEEKLAFEIIQLMQSLFDISQKARGQQPNDPDQFPISAENSYLPNLLQKLAQNVVTSDNAVAPAGLTPEANAAVTTNIQAQVSSQSLRKNIRRQPLSTRQIEKRRKEIRELEAKATRTVAEESRLSTLRAQLQRDSIDRIVQNFPQSSAAGTGIPQLFDIVKGMTPRVRAGQMTASQAVEINRLAAIAQIVESMTAEEQNVANDVDFTDARSRGRLATNQKWSQLLELLPLESAQKGRRFSRSAGNEATTVAGRVTDDRQLADAAAAVATMRGSARDSGPVYFDLETQNPSVEFLQNFIDRKYKPRKSDTEEQRREKERAKQVALRYLAMQQRAAARSGRSYDLTTDTKFIQRLGLTEAQLNKYRAPKALSELDIYQAAIIGQNGPEEMFALPSGTRKDILSSSGTVADITPFFPRGTSSDLIERISSRLMTTSDQAERARLFLHQDQIRNKIAEELNKGSQVVGHNIKEFDLKVLDREIQPEAVDTLEMSRRMTPRASHTLGGIYKDVTGSELVGAHDAFTDVQATKLIHEQMRPNMQDDRLGVLGQVAGMTGEARQQYLRGVLRYARPLAILQQFKQRAQYSRNAASGISGVSATMRDQVAKILGVDAAAIAAADPAQLQQLMTTQIDPILSRHAVGFGANNEFSPYAQYAVAAGGFRDLGDFNASYATLGQDLRTLSFDEIIAKSRQEQMRTSGGRSKTAVSISAPSSTTVPVAIAPGVPMATGAGFGGGMSGGGGGGIVGGTGGTFGGGPTGPVGPITIHTDSTIVHSAVTHLGDVSAVRTPSITGVDPTAIGHTGGALSAAAPSTVDPSLDPTAAVEMTASPSGFVTISNATISTLTGSAVEVKVAAGNTVHVNANFGADSAGALKKSLVYVGTGGATISGMDTGSRGFGGARNFASLSAEQKLALARLDLFKGAARVNLSEESDPVAREAIQQGLQRNFGRIAGEILQFESIRNSSITPRMRGMIGNLISNPDDSLSSLDDLRQQASNQLTDILVKRTRIEGDTGLSADERETQLQSLQESEQALQQFTAVVLRLSEEFDQLTMAATTRGPYASSGTGSTAGTRSRYGPAIETENIASQNALKAMRAQYDQYAGRIGTQNVYDSRRALTDQTRQTAASLINQNELDTLLTPAEMSGLSTAVAPSYNEVLAAVNEIQPMADEDRTLEQLAVNITRIASGVRDLSAALEKIPDTALTAEERKIKEALPGINKTVDAAITEQKGTTSTLETVDRQRAKTFEESLQATYGQQGLLRRITGSMRRELTDINRNYLQSFLPQTAAGQQALNLMMNRQGMLTAYNNRGRAVVLDTASEEEVRNLQKRVKSETGVDVSLEQLRALQTASARGRQAGNQSPFNDPFFFAMSRMRDLQFFGQTVMSTTQIPQQISQMIQQVGDPQLRADRILTTARALSLSPETYTKALAAAGKQQSMFGGTLTKNLEEMTSFIPIANTYGIDVGKSVQVARKLAAFDPAQGMGGASIALKEFLSGNVSSLSRRFEINRSELSRINTGDAGQMLESLDLLLSKMGVTDKLIDEQANSLAAKYDRMTGRLESLQVQFSAFAVGLMTPALEGVLGDDSAIARRVKASSTQKAVNERLRSYADSIVGNPVAGLKSLDIFSPTFSKELDIVLSKANDRTIAEAGSYGDVTGELSSVELYRQIGNMTDANKLKMQRMAQLNVLAGMNQDEAILKAMRDTNGDFNTSEEFMGQRRKLGFYNTASAEGRQRERDAFRRASTKTFNSNISNPGEKVTLVRQLDADTYIVRNAAGKEERVRIAGIDAPESATEAGAESTEEAGKFLAGKQLRLRRRGGLDPYGRTIGDISANNVDLASILVQQGYARVYNESDATKRAALEILQQTAADQGRGSVNKQAALLGLGANPIVSDEARSQYFRDTYLSTAGLFGVGGGAVLGGGLFALNSAAGTAAATSPIASLFTFLGGSASSAGTAAIPVAAPALIAAGLAGGAYLGYAYNRDVNDTSSAKQRELYRIESEIEQRRVYQGIADEVYNEGAAKERERLYQEAKKNGQRFGRGGGRGGGPASPISQVNYYAESAQFAQELEATNKVISERYNGLSEAEKRVYEVMVNNPITGEKSTVFAAIREITALNTRAAAAQAAGTPDTVAEDLLKNKASEINNFNRAATRTFEMAKELAFAQEYGIKVRYRPDIPRGERFESGMLGTLQNRVIDEQTYYGLSDSQKDEVNSQLIAVSSRANFQRFAKEYTDQSMEKLYQLTQQRFTQFTDANAVNALTAYNAPDRSVQALMANNYGMPNFTQLTTRQRIEQNAMQVLNRSQFVDGVEYDKSAGDNIRNAQAQAVKILLSQIQAYKEQEDITRQFNIQVKGTYSNFVQTMMNAADGGEMLTTYLSQGNPRGFLELSQQMSGFNVQSSLQNRVLMNNANLFGYNNPTTFGVSGPGYIAPSYNMGYTMGPRGTLKFSEDLLSDPSKMLYNPATMQSVAMQAAQANTELVNRNIQFGFRMRDANINHNRSLEDINRNGMRTLEDIHRNYTRNMLQLTQQAEAQKRQGTASFYTNAVGANVSASEKARITAKREQGQQEASHIGEADVGGYLKTPEGMQDSELQTAFAEYNAVPWDNYEVKQAAWKKVTDLLGSRRAAAQARFDNATNTDEKSAAQLQLGYLGRSPDREMNYRKYVDEMANQELDFAARKEQALRNRDDLQRERRRLEQQGPELQKRLAEAKTPEEMRSAQDAIEDNRVALEKNSQALQQNANEIEAVTKTAPLWADSWREAGKNILESTQSTISGLVTQLEDFNIKNAQTLADAYRGFTRAKEDMVRSFGDAATEIALAVPAKLAGVMAATTNYQRGFMEANILFDAGKYTEAKNVMSNTNRAMALSLYPEGTQGYTDMMAALNLQSNRFTAEGMKSADDNLGPSSLSAYGTTVNGKNVLRVVLFGKEADAIDNPGTVSTNQGGGNGEDAFLTNPRTGEKG